MPTWDDQCWWVSIDVIRFVGFKGALLHKSVSATYRFKGEWSRWVKNDVVALCNLGNPNNVGVCGLCISQVVENSKLNHLLIVKPFKLWLEVSALLLLARIKFIFSDTAVRRGAGPLRNFQNRYFVIDFILDQSPNVRSGEGGITAVNVKCIDCLFVEQDNIIGAVAFGGDSWQVWICIFRNSQILYYPKFNYLASVIYYVLLVKICT